MLKYSRLPFKTKYRELPKDATFTGSILFSTSWMEPVPMTRLACMETLREPLNIGSSGLLLKGSPVCWMETILDVQLGCLPVTWLNCAKISVALPENWDTTKTCGTDCCSLTILPKNTPYRLASGNARGSFTNSGSVSRDLAAKPAKLMAPNRRPLKKLLPVNTRPDCSTLVRGRSPFSTPQQSDENVGAQRPPTSRSFALSPSQSGLFRSTQSQNRSACDSRSSDFQCSDLRRFYPLFTPIYQGQNLADSGQCQMASIQSSERILRGKSAAPGIHLSASLFSRTQSDRTSLEDHSSQGNPQPLFPINRRPSVGSGIPIHNLEVT
jgi:hypothetical protein